MQSLNYTEGSYYSQYVKELEAKILSLMLQNELKDQAILSLTKDTTAQKTKLEQSNMQNKTFLTTIHDISKKLSSFQHEFELKEKRFGFAYDRLKVLIFLLDQQISFNKRRLSEFKLLENELASLQNDRGLLINHIQLISNAKTPTTSQPTITANNLSNSDRLYPSCDLQDRANSLLVSNQANHTIYTTKNNTCKDSAYFPREEPVKNTSKDDERFIELNSSDSFSFSSKTDTSKKVYFINKGSTASLGNSSFSNHYKLKLLDQLSQSLLEIM
jgi:hypothetical protein